MKNVFSPYSPRHSNFSFGRMGEIGHARATLGPDVPVVVYRLMLHTMAQTLAHSLGEDKAGDTCYEAGQLAGSEFVMYRLLLEDPPEAFFASLAALLRELRFGLLALERYEPKGGEVALTLAGAIGPAAGAESGPASLFEAGFLAGVMEAYTGKPYRIEELPATGEGGARRFTGGPHKE